LCGSFSGGSLIGGLPLRLGGILDAALVHPLQLPLPLALVLALFVPLVDVEFEFDVLVDALVVHPGRWGNDGQLVVRWYPGAPNPECGYPFPIVDVEVEGDGWAEDVGDAAPDDEGRIGVIPNAIRTECARCCGCGVPPPLPSLSLSLSPLPSPTGLSSASAGGLGARDCRVSVRRGPRKGEVLGVGCHAPLPLPFPLPPALFAPDPERMVSGSLSLIVCSLRGLALSRVRLRLSSGAPTPFVF
jgi:hypothetical protein